MAATNRNIAPLPPGEECVSRLPNDLTPEQWERAIRVARVITHAESFWGGDTEKSWRWLSKPNGKFGGKSPLEMLVTAAGAESVEHLLIQAEYGMFA